MAPDIPPSDLLTLFLQSLLKLQNVERGSIWVKHPDGYHCVLALDEKSQSEDIQGAIISDAHPSIVGWVIENGKMTISRPGEDSRHYGRFEKDFKIKSNIIICFPLLLESGEVYGAITLIDTTPTGTRVNLEKSYIDLLQNIVNVCSIALSKTLAHSRQLAENKQLKSRLNKNRGMTRIIGQSPEFLKILEKAKVYAKATYPVLITGESGTGKELFAEEIHRLSPRSQGPYLVQNCSAIPENLLESELFGHKKGSFSDALEDRIGLFEAAHGGTVFLDEIGDMPQNLQAKILRFMDKGEIKPIGRATTKQVNVRIIAATNIELETAIAEERFREDLFYRLNVLPLHLPPLRDRKDDITLLLERFVHTEAKQIGIRPKKLSPEAIDLLVSYPWNGNVRELLNFVRHVIVVTEGSQITPDALPAYIFGHRPAIPTSDSAPVPSTPVQTDQTGQRPLTSYTWRDLEEAYALALLEKNKWNISKAARLSGLNRSTFNSRLRKMQISK